MDKFKTIFLTILGTIFFGLGTSGGINAGVIEEQGRVYIVDRTGERWEITQAVSIGFKPGGFEFGIGRNAIRPLDDESLERDTPFADIDARVIGVENGTDAHAYVIRKLTRHEIANTHLGDTPIAAAY